MLTETPSTAFLEALRLLLTGDSQLWGIVGVSFSTTLRAILLATPPAFLLGFVLAIRAFRGRWLLISLFNTLLSLPTVVVGLVLYMLLSRSGPLGGLEWLFTQKAMVLGQMVLAFPILVAMSLAAFKGADARAWETALSLGARPTRALLTLMYEVRYGLAAATVAAYGRIIAEVGAAMMVGGNIAGHTRNIPTAIALETTKGQFAQGIALGLVLMLLAMVLNFSLIYFHRRTEAS